MSSKFIKGMYIFDIVYGILLIVFSLAGILMQFGSIFSIINIILGVALIAMAAIGIIRHKNSKEDLRD